ncbi:hypothetical protein EN833_30200 [Mesorhizobium sp. M4B.F.Ca.ET.190.01.1.1]|uniref:hypothetical protein n=1 Tax=unclassified Mesorhizobium TaxID=325217 RepID=UPI000FC9C6FF|nr:MULTISPECIES: hypothetical protein [unclassified Mesorhizobium]TIW68949.1 MAG: hypothetical protein E5V60_02845 [Mesorhizobium sp.]RVC47437.1 hypothetical protein EN781_00905 [Mesorhizobium sp. M4A.F.Ca.ET.090.04.2.1]TGR01292.1 hypothetical protein EN843_30195 [Mesorhizobium sp. M4B.F.Ca.ET.200.01.1.1]TGS13108.1 hypothetical protein EN833_30200 [Mesorhizobium sp. M4B.F.Ca.ET.190.01.1.1]TGT25487.1 hypothetical protein EN815_30180 [Mesorhizobium sp. M4B.F.Ca.ET.172.01.1.1]
MHQNRISSSLNGNGSEKSIVALLARQESGQVLSIWQHDRISEYLLAADSRRHTWHAWLATRGTAIRDVDETYRLFTFGKPREILTEAFGECPAGMISALGKFGPFARPRPVYLALHQVLSAGGPLANHIHQSAKVLDDDLVSLATAVTIPASNRVIRALLKCKMPAQVMVELLWVISRMAPIYDEQLLVRAITQGRQPAAILANLFSLTPFPTPPLDQTDALIPITTAQQLRKTGEEFANCLKGGEELAYALASIQSGQRYFYRWNGDNPTLLTFCRCGPTGWILAERSGPKNSRVTQATIDKIGEVLAGVPHVFVDKVGSGMLQWICTR